MGWDMSSLLLVEKDDMAAVLRLLSRRGAGLEGHG